MTQKTYRQPPRQKWPQIMEQQARTSQSQTNFCAAHGVAKSTFQYWKRQFKQASSPGDTQSPLDSLFLPLLTTDESDGEAAAPGGWEIELDLGGGVCLRLRRR